jgi:hypothetical protein
MTKMTRAQAVTALWRAGDLSWRLHEDQERVRSQLVTLRKKGKRIAVTLASRRWGKDYLATTLGEEQCLQQDRSQVRYAAPTQKMVRTIAEPHMHDLVSTAPGEVRPVWRSQEGVWHHEHNGSQIHMAGTDNGGADRLRGVSTDLGIASEAGFVDALTYLLHDVLIPQTATTGGFIWLISSPSVTPAHDFAKLCAQAEIDGTLIKRTIFDAPHIDAATREELCEIAGGPESTTWRREYLCEFVADTSAAVLPEFSRVEKDIIEARERPAYFVPLIVADIGFHDLTFVLFGYHDFRKGVDVIEAEYVTQKTIARDIDAKVKQMAEDLWGPAKAAEAMRYADAPPIVIAEMQGWQGIAKTQTDGNWKAAVINDVRTRLAEKSTRISPACEQLAAHCRYAIWRTPGRELERMDGFGHFDGVDALAYFTRLVDRHSNPFPLRAPGVTRDTHWLDDEPEHDLASSLAPRWRQPMTAGSKRR